MSGSTIGGVIGAVVFTVFGGSPQVGWMVGSAIGGYVDPTQVYGPRLSDVRGQTSQVGGAIPRAWGTAPVPGNVIWQQPGVTEHKHTDDGKGSGTEQVTYTYTRSYAIMFHLGEITGVLQIKRNGKIVYDARDDETLEDEYTRFGMTAAAALQRITGQRAENAKFMDRCRIYTGTQTQEPDPTIEAYKGVGNASAYHGRAYFVVTDDETQAGEIAQYEVIVAACGTTNVEGGGQVASLLIVGTSADSGTSNAEPCWANVDVLYPPSFVGIEKVAGETDIDTNPIPAYFGGVYSVIGLTDGVGRYSNDGQNSWHASSSPVGLYTHTAGPSGFLGHSGPIDQKIYKASAAAPISYTEVVGAPSVSTGGVRYTGSIYVLYGNSVGDGKVRLHMSSDGETWDERYVATIGDGYYEIYDVVEHSGDVYVSGRWFDGINSKYQVRRSTDGGETLPELILEDNTNVPYHIESGGGVLCILTKNGYSYSSADGFASANACGLVDTWDGRGRYLEYAGGYFYAIGSHAGLLIYSVASSDAITWSERADIGLGSAEALVGDTLDPSGTPVPDAPGWYVDENGDLTSADGYETVSPCAGVQIGEIVADLCEQSGLAPDEYDVSELTDTVDGYVIARETDAASVIESLRPVGMFDPAEWDGKVRFIKRGGTAVGSINGDDLVERDGDAVERELVQEVELLRKVTAGYLDTQAAWSPNTQSWERTVGTINARGESVVEVTAVMGADQAATIAKRKGLTAWGEPEKQKLSLPYRLAKYTPTDILNYTDADAEVNTIRLMQIDDDSGVREIESSLNCAEAYDATATGVAPKPPTITDASLLGPTRLVVMDLPLWRSSDADDIGLCVGGAGYLGSWSGAQVDVSEDGGTTYTTVAQITEEAVIGYTTTALTAWESSENPEEQEVTVYLPEAPSSVSYETLLRYANRAAVQLDSGGWEILQYETATALGDDLYTLSGLIRGRYNTDPGVVSADATFVLLNSSVQFVRAERDSLGQTLTVRATTYGTSSDAAVAFDYDFVDGASQTEWPVHNVEAERDSSGDIEVSCILRSRLGTETSPYQSVHFEGIRFSYTDGVDTFSYDVSAATIGTAATASHSYSYAQQIADFGSIPSAGITVTIAPLNDITGAGPSSVGVLV